MKPSSSGKPKIIEVFITSLKVTSEDTWMKEHIDAFGDDVFMSPHYRYLNGYYDDMYDWMKFRELQPYYITENMMEVLLSIVKEGQKEPIKIYRDMRINTGHKRAACMLFLGYSTIKAEVVPDNYKL